LPNLEFVEGETEWPRKVGMEDAMQMLIEVPGELPKPMNPSGASEILNAKDCYQMTEADKQMAMTGTDQLYGQFLLDRESVIRWTFTEVPEGERHVR
jgi:hypothetical protein